MKKGNTTRQRAKPMAVGQRQIAAKEKAVSKGPQRQPRSQSKVQLNKTSKPLDKKDVKRLAQEERKRTDQEKIVATKGARSVTKVTMAKRRMNEDKKRMAEERKKKAEMKRKMAEKEKKMKTFQRDVMREIDHLKTQERDEQKKRVKSTLSGVITRRTRQRLLESKRKGAREEDAKGAKKVSQADTENEGGSSGQQGFDLKLLVSRIDSSDKDLQLEATTKLRNYTTKNFNAASVEALIQLNVVPKIVQSLKEEPKTIVHFEGCWILNNIAASHSGHTKAVVDSGVIPLLVSMASVEDDVQMRESALSTLSNIAGDGRHFRDVVLESGILGPLVKILETSQMDKTIVAGLDLVKNFFRMDFSFDCSKQVALLMPVLKKHLLSSHGDSVHRACWAIYGILQRRVACNADFTETGEGSFCKILTDLCSHSDPRIVEGAVAALVDITAATDDMTQAVVDSGVLVNSQRLMTDMRLRIGAKYLLMLSNITAGTRKQVQAVLDANTIPTVIQILEKGEPAQKKEATWVIKNAAEMGSLEQIKFIADKGAISALCSVLTDEGVDVEIAVTGLYTILREIGSFMSPDGKTTNTQVVRNCGGVEKLQALKEAQQEAELHAKICLLLDDYLSV